MNDDLQAQFLDIWARAVSVSKTGRETIIRAFGDLVDGLTAYLQAAAGWAGWDVAIDRYIVANSLYAAFGVMVFAAVLFWLGGSRRGSENARLGRLTRRPRLAGYGAAGFLIVAFGAWSTVAPLASASIAAGVVSPDGNRKTVAHLEGGIIRNIHVREGDRIETGEPLVTLEDIQARARFEEMQERYLHLLAIEARLQAQRLQRDGIDFPQDLTAAENASVVSAMNAQSALMESQRATLLSRERILGQRMLQLKEQNDGLREVTAAQNRQLAFLQEELDSVQLLFDKGLSQAGRLLALKRALAALEAERAANLASIAENAQRVGETEIQLLTMKEQVIEKANDDLAEIQRQIAEIRSQMPSREDIWRRTVIRAPISGTVMNVRPTTESGVIRPGDPVLEIVPNEANLIIDARVRPNDVDRVRPGMEARVILTAYRQRSLPLIHGVLRSISADRLVEERTGEPYFLAKVEVNRKDIDGLENVRLIPGMPAEIMILNDEQTILQYLLDPLLSSLTRSFREE